MQRRNKGQEMGREGIQLGWGVRKTQGLQAVLTTGEKKGDKEFGQISRLIRYQGLVDSHLTDLVEILLQLAFAGPAKTEAKV